MATHIGPAFEGSQFVSGVPMDIILKGALMKDAKIEKNITEFKNEFKTIASQPIENEESAKYIREKLGQAVNNVKSFVNQGGIDFSQQESMSSLRGSVNEVIGDPEFMRRYKNDIEASGKRRQVETLKQMGSDKFSNENYAVFMKHYQDYVKDPNGSKMDYAYVEYDNYNERLGEVMKDIKPETRIRQVIRKVNGMDVIENVTEKFYDPDRVQQVITNTLGDKGIAQLKTNYDYQMMTSSDDNVGQFFTSSKNIITGFKDKILFEKTSLENTLSDSLPKEQQDYIKKRLELLDEQLKIQNTELDKVDKIISSNDGSDDYYKRQYGFDKFFSNKLKGMVGQYAIMEDVKTEIDPLSEKSVDWSYKLLEKDLDFKYDSERERLKNIYASNLERLKASFDGKTGPVGGGVPGNGLIKFDSEHRQTDTFLETMVGFSFAKNGEYQTPVEIAGAIVSGGQKPNSDGSYNVAITDENAFMHIASADPEAFGTLSAPKTAELHASKVFEDAYADWFSKNYKVANFLDNFVPGNARKDLKNYFTNDLSSYNLNNNPVLEFINSEEFKKINLGSNFKYNADWEDEFKRGTGLKSSKSIDFLLSTKMGNLGMTKFQVSNEKGNMIRTNNALTYVKGYATTSRSALNQMGADDDVIKELSKKGYLRTTNNVKGNALNNEIQVGVYVHGAADLPVVRDMYYREKSGDKMYDGNTPYLKTQFDNAYKAINKIHQINQLSDEELSSVRTNIEDNLDKLTGDVITKDQAEYFKNNINSLIGTITNPNGSNWSKLDAGMLIGSMMLAGSNDEQGFEELRKFVSNATGGVKLSSTVVKGEPLTVEKIHQTVGQEPTLVSGVNSYIVKEPISVQYNFGENHKLISGFLDAIASVEGGEYDIGYRGTKFSGFAKHPGQLVRQTIPDGPNKGKSSDAAGKYQFLSATFNEVASSLRLSDFSPASQDRAAWQNAINKGIITEQKLIEATHTGYLNIPRGKIFNEWEGVERKTDDFIKYFKKRTGITVNLI